MGRKDNLVSELLLQGLISARLVALCFFNSLVIFSSSELGSSGLLYSSSSSLSELSFIFSVSESCFFLAVAISAACLFRHLVLLFWNQTWGGEEGEGSEDLLPGEGRPGVLLLPVLVQHHVHLTWEEEQHVRDIAGLKYIPAAAAAAAAAAPLARPLIRGKPAESSCPAVVMGRPRMSLIPCGVPRAMCELRQESGGILKPATGLCCSEYGNREFFISVMLCSAASGVLPRTNALCRLASICPTANICGHEPAN
ncbi:hypothetical protein EYF80_052084 [Liparis tanakae]|uniref:Uncharacterized protein n=1 Tax=Liparis tanakae TaxID=230148 RepID=A0A4Z2F949_9TELE|nr:hypothetical protein EYF80_052084 [Liparis tanakae]